MCSGPWIKCLWPDPPPSPPALPGHVRCRLCGHHQCRRCWAGCHVGLSNRAHAGLQQSGGLGRSVDAGLGLAHAAKRCVSAPVEFFHVLLMLLGLWLLWRAEPPLWLGAWTQGIWRRIKPFGQRQAARARFVAPFLLGLVWALLHCGLLYSAVMLAALSHGILQGAQVMAAFALGGAVALSFVPWGLRRWKPGAAGLAAWGHGGVRLAGLVLAASSGTALWLGLVHNQAPWCVAP